MVKKCKYVAVKCIQYTHTKGVSILHLQSFEILIISEEGEASFSSLSYLHHLLKIEGKGQMVNLHLLHMSKIQKSPTQVHPNPVVIYKIFIFLIYKKKKPKVYIYIP